MNKNHSEILKAATAAVGLLGCCGFIFDHNGSVDPPEKTTIAVSIPDRESTIVLPISAAFDDLTKILESKVPHRLVDIQHERRDACVPAKYTIFCAVPRIGRRGCAVPETKTIITPAIDCELTGHVDRGSIALTGAGNQLAVVVPIDGEVTAKGRGEVGKNISVTGKGAGDASAGIIADIGSNWQPQASIDPAFKWTKPPGAWVLGFWVTFADRVQPELDKGLVELKQAVNSEVAKWDLPSQAAQFWKQGFNPVKLSSAPEVWLRFQPRGVGFAPLDFSNNRVEARLMVKGVTEIFVGAEPSAVAPSALPPLTKELPDPGFQISLPVVIDYATAEDAMRLALNVGKTQKITVPHVGKVSVEFHDVSIYGTSNGQLAVGINLTADPPGDFFKTSGTIWLTGKVRLDTQQKRLMASPDAPFDFRGHTDSIAANLLLSVLRLPAIKTRIERSLLNIDISQKYDAALAQATTAMNRSLGQGMNLQTTISSVEFPADVSGSTAGILLRLELKGTSKLATASTVPLAAAAVQ